jgi:hypothetical protein
LSLLEDVSGIYKRMSHAAMRAGRDPGEVRLVAVTKTVGPGMIKEAYDLGLRAFGESRVQEAEGKIEALKGLAAEWHLIGHLQRNKAKKAVALFDLIHSVDSVELMAILNKNAAESGKIQRVLIQVNIAGERQKHGVGEAETDNLVSEAAGMKNIRVEGLMTIPPYTEDPEGSRPYYRRLRELVDKNGLREASMGMTHDFEVAIEEGATLVRVGTAIFGERRKR